MRYLSHFTKHSDIDFKRAFILLYCILHVYSHSFVSQSIYLNSTQYFHFNGNNETCTIYYALFKDFLL